VLSKLSWQHSMLLTGLDVAETSRVVVRSCKMPCRRCFQQPWSTERSRRADASLLRSRTLHRRTMLLRAMTLAAAQLRIRTELGQWAPRDRHTTALGDPQMPPHPAYPHALTSGQLTLTLAWPGGFEHALTGAFAEVQMRQLWRVPRTWSLLDLRRLHDAASRHGL